MGLWTVVYGAGVTDSPELRLGRRIYVLILMPAEILNRRVVQRRLGSLLRRHLNEVHVRRVVVQIPARRVAMVNHALVQGRTVLLAGQPNRLLSLIWVGSFVKAGLAIAARRALERAALLVVRVQRLFAHNAI